MLRQRCSASVKIDSKKTIKTAGTVKAKTHRHCDCRPALVDPWSGRVPRGTPTLWTRHESADARIFLISHNNQPANDYCTARTLTTSQDERTYKSTALSSEDCADYGTHMTTTETNAPPKARCDEQNQTKPGAVGCGGIGRTVESHSVLLPPRVNDITKTILTAQMHQRPLVLKFTLELPRVNLQEIPTSPDKPTWKTGSNSVNLRSGTDGLPVDVTSPGPFLSNRINHGHSGWCVKAFEHRFRLCHTPCSFIHTYLHTLIEIPKPTLFAQRCLG